MPDYEIYTVSIRSAKVRQYLNKIKADKTKNFSASVEVLLEKAIA